MHTQASPQGPAAHLQGMWPATSRPAVSCSFRGCPGHRATLLRSPPFQGSLITEGGVWGWATAWSSLPCFKIPHQSGRDFLGPALQTDFFPSLPASSLSLPRWGLQSQCPGLLLENPAHSMSHPADSRYPMNVSCCSCLLLMH